MFPPVRFVRHQRCRTIRTDPVRYPCEAWVHERDHPPGTATARAARVPLHVDGIRAGGATRGHTANRSARRHQTPGARLSGGQRAGAGRRVPHVRWPRPAPAGARRRRGRRPDGLPEDGRHGRQRPDRRGRTAGSGETRPGVARTDPSRGRGGFGGRDDVAIHPPRDFLAAPGGAGEGQTRPPPGADQLRARRRGGVRTGRGTRPAAHPGREVVPDRLRPVAFRLADLPAGPHEPGAGPHLHLHPPHPTQPPRHAAGPPPGPLATRGGGDAHLSLTGPGKQDPGTPFRVAGGQRRSLHAAGGSR